MLEPSTHQARTAAAQLHRCEACRQPFVVLEEVIAVLPPEQGSLAALRCMNCAARRVATYGKDTLKALDDELGRSQALIAADAERMEKARFAQEIAVFAMALRGDLVLPEDF